MTEITRCDTKACGAALVCSVHLCRPAGFIIIAVFLPFCRAGGGPHIEPQYRQFPQITKNQLFQAELLSGAMWFWILWHLWHDPDAVFVSKLYLLPGLRQYPLTAEPPVTQNLQVWGQ